MRYVLPWAVAVFLTVAWAPRARHIQETTSARAVLNGKLLMFLPKSFSLVPPNAIALKYPNPGHRPSEVYTNPNASVNIALNQTANQAKSENLSAIKKLMDGQFTKPNFTLINSEMVDINGKSMVLIEFVSAAADAKIYNLMVMTSVEGRLTMITFNCTESMRAQWEPMGKKMIKSIKVN